MEQGQRDNYFQKKLIPTLVLKLSNYIHKVQNFARVTNNHKIGAKFLFTHPATWPEQRNGPPERFIRITIKHLL
jgi:hypothetical protein